MPESLPAWVADGVGGLIRFVAPVEDEAALGAGRYAMHALVFFVSAMQTGFGPFVAVWLISQGWSLTQVGLALSVGTIAGLCAQLPGGALVDAVDHKRNITIAALGCLATSALMIAWGPSVPVVWMAQALHALGSAVVTPAIAALTLSLCGHDSYSDRLGGNARYGSIGGALAAAGFGLASGHLGQQSIFLITAALALPAAASLFAMKQSPPPEHVAHMAIAPRKARQTKPKSIYRDPAMHVFAFATVLFQLSNAALLTLALGGLSQRGDVPGYLVPVAIIVPQGVVALASPWAGAMARTMGRRPVLLAGFIALPVRAVLFATNPAPELMGVIQVLDGVSATVVGLMLPLIAADLTRNSGHLNLAIGSFGLAAGLGATFSTTVAGWIADTMGAQVAFLSLALVGLAATLLLAFAMPETQPKAEAREVAAAAA
jgi:MFS family permease